MAYTYSQATNMTGLNIFKKMGQPQIHEPSRKDGKPLPKGFPIQIVKSAEWKEWNSEKEEADIRLVDFGNTFEQGHEPAHLAQPNSLRAPETILSDKFDYRVDLWDAGVTVGKG
jgi:serine/threonine-protein kinase SRPK3